MERIKSQDDRVFRSRLSVVLLATGCAILVAAVDALADRWQIWRQKRRATE